MSFVAHLRWLFTRLLRPTAQSDKLAPVLIEDLLDDFEGGESNLLRYSATQKPLRVAFEMWENSDPSPDGPETLTLFWNDQPVDSKTWTATVAETDLFIIVPERYMSTDGKHTLRYEVELYNSNVSVSRPLDIYIFTTPPELAKDSALLFDPAVIANGVTDAYLQTNGDALPAMVPAYKNVRPGDVLTWYWSKTVGGQDLVDSWTLTLDDTSKPLQINFPGELIRKLGDGMRYAHYTVQDRAGTPLQHALPIKLQCNATPLPTRFAPPYLKETGSTGSSSTLKPARATNGGTAVIKSGSSFEPDDIVTMYFAHPGEHGAFSAVVSIAPGEMECAIPRANIAARMGSKLELYFEVTRRGKNHPSDPHLLKVEAPDIGAPQSEQIGREPLSLSKMGPVTFTLERWVLKDTGQFVRLYITGVRNDGSKDPVVVAEATPVPSADGDMTIGTVTADALRVFVTPSDLEILAFLSVDNKQSWITSLPLPVQLVK